MSVLITGMKLPKFCRACQFAGFGGRACELNVCMFTGESQPTLSPERMSKCPLVEIPPHGRLIDAERVKQAMWNALFAEEDRTEKLYGLNAVERRRVQDGFEAALRAVVDAPTVIPAEEEN